MKKEFYIFALSIALGLGSCNSWLDVKPETEVEIDAMYSQQQGFQDALIGAYLNLKSSNAYGQELMYGTVEYLAQHWNYNSETVQEKISRYNYIDESVQGRFESIYSQLYKIIASVNVILANIDAKQDVFETDIYEIIKGEALAMRAYCHFDLLRLFGPMPTNVGSSTILPYVTTVTTEYHQHHTYEQYVSYLEEDLITADTLLKKSDPVQTSIATEENSWSVSATDFLRARQLRFNYYAVKALEARFYLWLEGTDNKTKAYQAAKEVIDATNEDGSKKYKLGTVNDITNKDYSFSVEHIMAVYDYDLYDRASGNFTESAPFAKEEALITNDLYEPGSTDIRYISLWETYSTSAGSSVYSIKKFLQPNEDDAINQLPLLRLSEMYFIVMECGPINEANELYEEFCISRDIPIAELHENQIQDILVEEYNKEFYAEGQAFYAFKRLAVEDILWAQDPGNEESYVIPLPLSEIDYGNN